MPFSATRLLKFLLAKTKDAVAPLDLDELSKIFKSETHDDEHSVEYIKEAILICGFVVTSMTDMRTEKQVKMLFALSIPVGGDFLERLRQHAEVQLDSSRRIINYKSHGGIQLSGSHPAEEGSIPEKSKRTGKYLLARFQKAHFEFSEMLKSEKRYASEEESSEVMQNCYLSAGDGDNTETEKSESEDSEDSDAEVAVKSGHVRTADYSPEEDRMLYEFVFKITECGIDKKQMKLGSPVTWERMRGESGIERSAGSLRKRWSETLQWMGYELQRCGLPANMKEALLLVFCSDWCFI